MTSNSKMKILIIEDDIDDCNSFRIAVNKRNDIEIVATTDSDIEAIQYVKVKRPEGIVLDIELNNSLSGNADAFEFLNKLKSLNLDYTPIIIVTTHINSKTTYDMLHRKGVELILYKDQPKYSSNLVLNHFINLRKPNNKINYENEKIEEVETKEEKIAKLIDSELELIGMTNKLKGRNYAFDAIFYLIKNEKEETNVIQYLVNKYKKSNTTITNGIQNAIIHAWRVTPIEDLEKYYTARVNYETGIPTTMEFIYYYVKKIKNML